MGVRQQCALREDCDKCHHWDSYCKVKVLPPISKLDSVHEWKILLMWFLYVCTEGFSSSWRRIFKTRQLECVGILP